MGPGTADKGPGFPRRTMRCFRKPSIHRRGISSRSCRAAFSVMTGAPSGRLTSTPWAAGVSSAGPREDAARAGLPAPHVSPRPAWHSACAGVNGRPAADHPHSPHRDPGPSSSGPGPVLRPRIEAHGPTSSVSTRFRRPREVLRRAPCSASRCRNRSATGSASADLRSGRTRRGDDSSGAWLTVGEPGPSSEARWAAVPPARPLSRAGCCPGDVPKT